MREGFTPAQRRYAVDSISRQQAPYLSQMAEMDPRSASLTAGAFQAGTQNAISDASFQMNKDDVALYNQKRGIMAQSYAQEASDITTAANQTTQNKNAVFGNLGNIGAGYFNTTKGDETQDLNARLQMLNQQEQIRQAGAQSGANAAGLGIAAGSQFGQAAGQFASGLQQYYNPQQITNNPTFAQIYGPTPYAPGNNPFANPVKISFRHGGYPMMYKHGGEITNPYV